MRLVWTFGVALLLGATLGCDAPATQLVVLVDTDFEVNESMAVVRATVLDDEGSPVSSHEFSLADDAESDPGPARVSMPFSFAVVPVGDDASRRVTVVVEGLGGTGDVLVQRVAVTGFVEEQTLALPMFLARSCRLDGGLVCPEGQTCTEAGCQDQEISPEDLRAVIPGREFEDAGTADAGTTDAGDGLDSGPLPDGGFDGGPECGERVACGSEPCRCPDGASCCTLECSEAGCTPLCDRGDACVVDARERETVTAECGMRTTCFIDARGATDVSVECFMSDCYVDCGGAQSCALTCNVSSACVLRCADATTCEMRGCMGEVVSCGDDVLACRTACP